MALQHPTRRTVRRFEAVVRAGSARQVMLARAYLPRNTCNINVVLRRNADRTFPVYHDHPARSTVCSSLAHTGLRIVISAMAVAEASTSAVVATNDERAVRST